MFKSDLFGKIVFRVVARVRVQRLVPVDGAPLNGQTFAAERVRLNDDGASRKRSFVIFSDGLAVEQFDRFAQKIPVPAEHDEFVGAGRVEAKFRALVNGHSARFSVLDRLVVNICHTVGKRGSVALTRQGVADAQVIAQRDRGKARGGVTVDQFAERKKSARAEFGCVTVRFDFVNIAVFGIA